MVQYNNRILTRNVEVPTPYNVIYTTTQLGESIKETLGDIATTIEYHNLLVFASFLKQIGSPTMDNNGIVSEFSSSNYYSVTDPETYSTNEATYLIKFTTGSNIYTEQAILWQDTGLKASVYSGYLVQWNNARTNIISLESNTTYWLQIAITDSTTFVGAISTDGITYTNFTGTDSFTTPCSLITIGNRTDTSRYFYGSIDLCNSSINGVTLATKEE